MKPKLNRDHRNYIDEIFLVFAKKNKAPREIKIKPQTQLKTKTKKQKQKHSDSTYSHGPTEAGERQAIQASVPHSGC